MKINFDKVPKNLNEAIEMLTEAIESEEERERLKDYNGLHFGLGGKLRNIWSLWERETILVQWFKANLGLIHADDISGIILKALSSSLKGEEFDAKVNAQVYIDYWKKLNINP